MTDAPEQNAAGRRYTSADITVWYDVHRCRHAAECVRGDPEVFQVSRKPWIRPELASAETVAEVVRRCPTGALQYRLADGSGEEPETPTHVSLRPDGALWIRGDLRLETPAGVRAETRAALCGCGRSAARPYCDGACTRPVADAPAVRQASAEADAG